MHLATNDHRWLDVCQVAESADRFLQHRAVCRHAEKLLGVSLARQGPEPSSDATSENNGYDLVIRHSVSLIEAKSKQNPRGGSEGNQCQLEERDAARVG